MAYPTMTAEEYVVDELRNAKIRIESLIEEITVLKDELDAKADIIYKLVNRLEVRNDDYFGYIADSHFNICSRFCPELMDEIMAIKRSLPAEEKESGAD